MGELIELRTIDPWKFRDKKKLPLLSKPGAYVVLRADEGFTVVECILGYNMDFTEIPNAISFHSKNIRTVRRNFMYIPLSELRDDDPPNLVGFAFEKV